MSGSDAEAMAGFGSAVGESFFARSADVVAPDLLGCVLVAGGPDGSVALRIVEVEAYGGQGADPASHAYRGPTKRNQSMFGPPGSAYVYLSYGVHHCLNLVCAEAGQGEAVLIRGGDVVAGEALVAARRPGASGPGLAIGPGRLSAALGIDLSWDGLALGQPIAGGRFLAVLRGRVPPTDAVRCGPRVGISRATDRPWRFWTEAAAKC
ncbi:MAG: DNA-3-methyladenine glycosylase [Candidatus Nanopelagicales bacterium]|nr:DNA-3-methyladenine glycosylase [Candidatus Nanopelagicales bacterium]MDZ4249644.1 DNA-3-methyladenine glycosylase [Candidatus Nanopelagicales bacterium]